MPNKKSAMKRTRQNEKRRLRNRSRLVSARNQVKRLIKMTDKTEAEKILPDIVSRLDKLAQKNIIHKNTAANQKSRLVKFVSSLS